jgi:outer membrane protein OmpA-like peptidoglycan-associated protein
MTIVQQVAGSLQNNPQLELLEIQGHADERGRMQHNIDLTRDRALSVRRALIGFGVSEERLHYAGYGPLCPVALGHAEVAWRQNRRVVFLILRTSGVSSRGRVACRRAEHLIPEDDLEFHDSNAPDNPTTPAR